MEMERMSDSSLSPCFYPKSSFPERPKANGSLMAIPGGGCGKVSPWMTYAHLTPPWERKRDAFPFFSIISLWPSLPHPAGRRESSPDRRWVGKGIGGRSAVKWLGKSPFPSSLLARGGGGMAVRKAMGEEKGWPAMDFGLSKNFAEILQLGNFVFPFFYFFC